MIHTSRTVTVGKMESVINEPIMLYRGDREVEIEFNIVGSKFMFSNGGNVIKSTNATNGQLVINTPTGENMFSEVTECNDGKVICVITKEMIDELAEVGFYSFQIRLFDESQVSRVTIPPVYQGIEIRNPIAAEDETDLVDIGLVDFSVVRKDNYENVVTFLPNGDYNKTLWEEHDVISKDRLNKVEDALYEINKGTEGLYPTFQNQYDEFSAKVNKDVKAYKEEIEDEVEQFERDMTQQWGEFKVDYPDDINSQLVQRTNFVNPFMFGAKGDGITNDYESLKKCFEFANTNGYTIYIPNKKFKVVCEKLDLATSIVCEGEIILSDIDDQPFIEMNKDNELVTLPGTSLTTTLYKYTNKIPELSNYEGYSVSFSSRETNVNRGDGTVYYKQEHTRILKDGLLSHPLNFSYDDKTELTLKIYKDDKPISIDNLKITCEGDTINGTDILRVFRNNVTFNNLKLTANTSSNDVGQKIGVDILDSDNITFNNCTIKGFTKSGFGYGIAAKRVCDIYINNCYLVNNRHSYCGHEDNYIFINGGVYESYSACIDTHWGWNIFIENAILNSYVYFAGENFTIKNCVINNDKSRTSILKRPDSPFMGGYLNIEGNTIYITNNSNSYFTTILTYDYDYKTELVNPHTINIKNNLFYKNNNDFIFYPIWISDETTGINNQNMCRTINIVDNEIVSNESSTASIYLGSNSKFNSRTCNVNISNFITSAELRIETPFDSSEVTNDLVYRLNIKDCESVKISVNSPLIKDIFIENCSLKGILSQYTSSDIESTAILQKVVNGIIKIKNSTLMNGSVIRLFRNLELHSCFLDNFETVLLAANTSGLSSMTIGAVYNCTFNNCSLSGYYGDLIRNNYVDASYQERSSIYLPSYTTHPTRGVRNGMMYYNTSENTTYIRENGKWKSLFNSQ